MQPGAVRLQTDTGCAKLFSFGTYSNRKGSRSHPCQCTGTRKCLLDVMATVSLFSEPRHEEGTGGLPFNMLCAPWGHPLPGDRPSPPLCSDSRMAPRRGDSPTILHREGFTVLANPKQGGD